jgi:uncharacterized damage-inducible protein DinB
MPDIRFSRLFQHMWWADEHVLDALRRATSPPERVIERYAHLLAAELVWLDRVEGATQSVPVWPNVDLAQCARLASTARKRYETFLAGPTAGDLERIVHYANSAGQEFDTPLGDILVHVALHGAYHRGQVALMLRDAGAEPAPTDYIAFVRGAPAATRGDAR